MPIFLVGLTGVIEFGLLFSAQLSINYASRDAALIAAESGNQDGADCMVLQKVEQDVGPPAERQQIQSVTISWTDENGTVKVIGGVPASNVWQRTGSTVCNLVSGTVTIPYTQTTNDYPEVDRCNILEGCPAPHDEGVDTIAVDITYQYNFHTPLGALVISSGATGWPLEQSNAMRMEPVL